MKKREKEKHAFGSKEEIENKKYIFVKSDGDDCLFVCLFVIDKDRKSKKSRIRVFQ
jgi:hypothetical protein